MFEVKFFNFYTALPKEGDPALAGTLDYLKTFEKEISLKTKLLKYIKTKKEINGKIVEVMEKKGDMDVDIALDVTKAIDTLDALLIVSGDSDLLPLKNYSLDKGKKIAFAGYMNKLKIFPLLYPLNGIFKLGIYPMRTLAPAKRQDGKFVF